VNVSKKRMMQNNSRKTLERLADLIESGQTDSQAIVNRVDRALDTLLDDDVFGTEGQWDPRGDQRNDT